MADTNPPAVVEDDVQNALKDVMGGLLRRVQEQREQDPEYQRLFAACKDGGIARALFDAERRMRQIAADLAVVLEKTSGTKIDHELYTVLLGLPLAMRTVRSEIEQADGLECCADKARWILKTYLYERLRIDIGTAERK